MFLSNILFNVFGADICAFLTGFNYCLEVNSDNDSRWIKYDRDTWNGKSLSILESCWMFEYDLEVNNYYNV